MKGLVSVMWLLISSSLFTASTFAADSPVTLTHTLSRYEKGAEGVSLQYSLHVVNRGEKLLTNVILTVFPSPVLPIKRTTLSVGTLTPGASTDLCIDLEAPVAPAKERLSREPLLLAGTCEDPEGKVLEFPARSYPGDAP